MFKKSFVCALSASICLALVPASWALIIDYGDFTGTDVMFLDVSEDTRTSPIALFGSPDVSGNQMDFDPLSFTAGPISDGSTVTDGQLNFTVMSIDPNTDPIQEVWIDEAGDYTLAGLGNAEAVVSVGAAVRFTVLELNGVVTPLQLDGSAIMTFTPNTPPDPNGTYSLANAGPGTSVLWDGSLHLDIDDFLANHPDNPMGSATKIEFSLDNTLTAAAANGGTAFIAKKDSGVTVTVPEPASLGLVLSLVLGLGAAIRRKM